MANSVEITGTQQVVVTQTTTDLVVLAVPSAPAVVEVITEGPQGERGPSGDGTGGLPTGGDPGNVLLKSTYGNYDAVWSPVVDGGTFN